MRLMKGDITELEVDAIVNPANTKLLMGGGVAGAIKRKGGREIEEEALRKGPVPIGEAVVTGAGRLRARYVIHAPTVMTPGGRSSPQYVRKAVRAALKKAKELGLKVVAFPAMGSGVGGVPVEVSAKILKEESENSGLDVILVLYTDEDYERAVKALRD